MKLILKKSTTYISFGFALAGLLVVLGLFLFVNRPATAQSEGGRLITLHDRGVETAFITTKATLREALAEQNIRLDAKDAVEPSVDEKLVAPDYQVNIYRARPVTIIDGAVRQKIITPYQTPERIVSDAGITLHAEDETSLERSADYIGDGAGLQLNIDRATVLSLNLYGKVTDVRTQADTIGDMLKEKNIELGANGRASLPLETSISHGLSVRIWQEGKQTVTVDEEVAFTTEQVKDADRVIGYKEVQTPGIAGKRTATYEITIQNGIEISRTEIASIVTQEPVKEVVIVGSKSNNLPYSGSGSKSDWLAASNIPQDAWGYVDYMVAKESSWNPNAVNASSGACGLAQALPCSKVPGNPYDPVNSLNWMNNYVNGRYGGWQEAYNFWVKNRWY